jgi:hypothetical protein
MKPINTLRGHNKVTEYHKSGGTVELNGQGSLHIKANAMVCDQY